MMKETESHSKQKFSYDQAVQEAKRLFETTGHPMPVTIDSNLLPGIPSGYNQIVWDGTNVRLTLPTQLTTHDDITIPTSISGHAEIIPQVGPLPKEAQN